MSSNQRSRIPVTPTVLIGLCTLLGIAGVVMLFLGIGGIALTELKVPGINLNVGTTSVALAITIVGFGLAVVLLALVFAYARGQTAEKRKILQKILKDRPDLTPDEVVALITAMSNGALVVGSQIDSLGSEESPSSESLPSPSEGADAEGQSTP
jgi:amino acid transporter